MDGLQLEGANITNGDEYLGEGSGYEEERDYPIVYFDSE
jgi:hypothetical protein